MSDKSGKEKLKDDFKSISDWLLDSTEQELNDNWEFIIDVIELREKVFKAYKMIDPKANELHKLKLKLIDEYMF